MWITKVRDKGRVYNHIDRMENNKIEKGVKD